jgi:hypothetical protein
MSEESFFTPMENVLLPEIRHRIITSYLVWAKPCMRYALVSKQAYRDVDESKHLPCQRLPEQWWFTMSVSTGGRVFGFQLVYEDISIGTLADYVLTIRDDFCHIQFLVYLWLGSKEAGLSVIEMSSATMWRRHDKLNSLRSLLMWQRFQVEMRHFTRARLDALARSRCPPPFDQGVLALGA